MKATRYRSGPSLVLTCLVLLAGCGRKPPSSEGLTQYLDAEAVYLTLQENESLQDLTAPLTVTGRIHRLPPLTSPLPWLLDLKAQSDEHTLAAEVAAVQDCDNASAPSCVTDLGGTLLRGQRIFLHCEQTTPHPAPQLLGCTLSLTR